MTLVVNCDFDQYMWTAGAAGCVADQLRLEPGSQSLVLRYDAGLLAGASGPFELRDLNLLDQGRMGVLQRQQRALTIEERDMALTGAHAATPKPEERVKLPPVT